MVNQLPSSNKPLAIFMKKMRGLSNVVEKTSTGDSFIIKDYFDKKEKTTLITIVLIGKGCEWARKGGGCSMCGFFNTTSPYADIDKGQLFCQFKNELKKYERIKNSIHLLIYTSGSFLDEKEVILKDQDDILRHIEKDKRIKQVDLESLPRFISEKKLKSIKNILKSTKFGISIGLESANETIRNFIIHKEPFTNKQLSEITPIIKKYGDLKLNIILKPPLLTEREAIEDTISSITFANNIGADFLYIAGCNVQPSTLTHFMWEKGLYMPPYLWSIYEIYRRTKDNNSAEIVFGGFNDYPKPIAHSQNCVDCEPIIVKMLENNIDIFPVVECDCKEIWEKEIQIDSIDPLEKRISDLYTLLDKEQLKL